MNNIRKIKETWQLCMIIILSSVIFNTSILATVLIYLTMVEYMK